LIAEVWQKSVVDENNLAAQISALRKVLAADPALAGGLQTVPGRGYRLITEVERIGGKTARPAETIAQVAAGEPPSLVVLPFVNLSSDPDQSYFAQGLSQTVSTDLSRISGLLVISSATAATFEGKAADARRASSELRVRYVLSGSVQARIAMSASMRNSPTEAAECRSGPTCSTAMWRISLRCKT
jgi:putative component of membrane protein insertase Oxa1/YidC/SpoIIIJ protein YidD